MPAETHELAFLSISVLMCDLNIFRSRSARRELAKLCTDQATGPDHIDAIVLRGLAKELALPTALIARRIFREEWPRLWKVH